MQDYRAVDNMTVNDIVDTFPGTKGVVKRNLAILRRKLAYFDNVCADIRNRAYGAERDPEKAEFLAELLITAFVERDREPVQKHHDELKRILTCIEGVKGYDIPRAKAVPIENYVHFNRAGFAKCVWHTENHASMKYYPKQNRVHCFGGCGRSGDVIDVVRQLYGVEFKGALGIILGT